MPERVVAEELELLGEVSTRLARGPANGPPSETQIVEELERIREQLLRDGLDDFERSSLETRWNVQSAVLRQLRASRAAPQVDPASPYFAHLRLEEEDRVRDLCLGRATFLDHGVRIVDWRHAPIARLYYRYRQGEDYEEDIGGRTREGMVLARRAVAIRDGRLERVEAPEGRFVADDAGEDGWRRIADGAARLSGGEGAALRVHRGEGAGERRFGTDPGGRPRRADKHLPDIAGLIDPEQFALIARPDSGYAAIRGAAGSGKTTVALHRIAWLAYEDPEIDSARTLFVVFSQGLRSYVAHVLPALGVEHVSVRTYAEWAGEQRRRLFPRLPARVRENPPPETQRLKLHSLVLSALPRQIEQNPGKATPEQVIDDWMSLLTNEALLRDELAKRPPGSLTERALARAVQDARARNDELRAFIDGDRSAPAELDVEDDAILLRAWQLRVGTLPESGGGPLRYRHVAVDEVQDFAPLEVRVLIDCLDARRSLTLAGDTQQHVGLESGFTSWSAFFDEVGLSGTHVDTLQVSYRSSREITRFALDLLGELREDEVPPEAPRSGPPVELFRFTDPGACVAFLAEALIDLASEEPLASVAVLTPSPEVSALYARGLASSEVPRLHHVRRQDFRFAPGVEVTEIEQVKGLEFDYVVLVDADAASYPDEPRARRRLHVGATRAIHQLWMTSVGAPSPVIEQAIARDGGAPTESHLTARAEAGEA